ncbi:MAG: hypothetical protein A2Z01_01210 [Betaproteobacteria bacterium RBG_16_58_11]|nr:MAG: hypothetical protein A2Z01_01210 [Betaproteobacteria bacterium RBG_16_58_11]
MPHSAVRALSKALIVLVTTFYLPSAYAEVTDKVPTLSLIWGVAIASGAVCFIATYFRRWLLILAAFPAVWFLTLFLEIHSSDVGPAVLIEAGRGYLVQAYLAALSVAALGILGWILNAQKRRI